MKTRQQKAASSLAILGLSTTCFACRGITSSVGWKGQCKPWVKHQPKQIQKRVAQMQSCCIKRRHLNSHCHASLDNPVLLRCFNSETKPHLLCLSFDDQNIYNPMSLLRIHAAVFTAEPSLHHGKRCARSCLCHLACGVSDSGQSMIFDRM